MRILRVEQHQIEDNTTMITDADSSFSICAELRGQPVIHSRIEGYATDLSPADAATLRANGALIANGWTLIDSNIDTGGAL